MSIPVVCPSCQARLRVSEEFIGRQMKCSQCAAVLTVAEPGSAAGAAKPDRKSRSVDEQEDGSEAGRPARRRAGKSKKGDNKKVFIIAGAALVVAVGVVLLLLLLFMGDPSNPNVTKENFDKIVPEKQTLEDVEKILGKATRASESDVRDAAELPRPLHAGPVDNFNPANPPETWYWQNGRDFIFVIMLGTKESGYYVVAQSFWIGTENGNRILRQRFMGGGPPIQLNLTEIKNQAKK